MIARAYSEAMVLRSALALIAARPSIVRVWRSNNAGVRRCDRSGREFWSHAGLIGVSDILGYVRRSGRLFAAECKRPAVKLIGQRAGGLTDDQRSFLTDVIEAGCVGFVFDDVKTLTRVLDGLQRDPWAIFDINGNRTEG